MIRAVLISVFCIISVLVSQAQEVLKDGHTIFYYGNGKISSEGLIRDGKPDGLWKTYYVDGKLKSIGIRRNFELDSIWLFYNEKGYLTQEVSYLRGKKSGYSKKYKLVFTDDTLKNILISKELFLNDLKEKQGYYYDNKGKIKRIVRYKNNKKHGLTREFNTDSLIQAVYKYHNDFLIDREFINQYDDNGLKQGVWRSYYDNDNIRQEENYKDGKLNGYLRKYDNRGQLLESVFYENGVEIVRNETKDIQVEIVNKYDDNGKIIASGGFINDTPVGIHREYTDKQSVIKVKEYDNAGQIISDGITDDKGQKDEYWKFYYQDGKIRSEGNFRSNRREGVWKFYLPDGQLEQTGSYKNGLEDGLWTWYYKDGSLRREENYYRGKEDGLSVEYDKSGNVIARGEYIEGLEEGEWYYKYYDYTEKGKYINGNKDGLWQQFYLDGTLKYRGSYIQGFLNGKQKYYYQSGKLKEEKYYEMGLKERTWRKFDEEGNILFSASYSRDVLVKIDGVRVNLEK